MQYCSRLLILFILFFPTQISAQSTSLKDRDITGLWKGTMYNDTTQKNYRYEIAISEKKGKLYGFSHTYFILDNREYHGVKKLKIKRDGTEIITEDVDLIANNYPIEPPKGIRERNTLKFEIKDSVMVLSGKFATNRTRIYSQNTGFIYVERKNDFRQSALIPHLEELGLAQDLSFVQEAAIAKTKPEIKPAPVTEQPIAKITPIVKEKPVTEQPVVKTTPVTKPEIRSATATEKPIVKTTPVVKEKPVTEQTVVKTTPVTKEKPVEAKLTKVPETTVVKNTNEQTVVPAMPSAVDVAKRTVETIQALYFKTDSLVLTLYDNGEVDGDTVSVLMNGKVIMPRVGLSTNAVQKTIYIKDFEDSVQIVMYAETLGTLPPNTGLLIVYDGTDRYEIRFSGDMERSSAIMFRRKK